MKVQKILIAVDDSKYAENAADYGFELARLYGAQVGLVNIVEPIIYPPAETDNITGLPFTNNNIDDTSLVQVQKESAENTIHRIADHLAGEVQVTQFTEYGPTQEGILKCANEFNADLIVLGTHSRTGIDRLIMGSVAEHVVRHAVIPVLVVPLREGS